MNHFSVSIGGPLTAGVQATVTFAPVPPGVNGSNVGHYLYISDGTPEAVLITGGTAVAGSASGTITFVPAHSHSEAAWTISSATGGVQEACFAGEAPILLGASVAFHAPVTFPTAGGITIRGAGMMRSVVIRAADYPTGNLFQTNGGTTWIDLSEFRIFNPAGLGTSGASIYYNSNGAGGYSNLSNLYIVNGSIGVKIESGSNVKMRGLEVHNFDTTSNPVAALWITGTGAIEPFGIFISDSSFGSIGEGVGFLLDAVDQLMVSNTAFGGNHGIYVRGVAGGTYIANVTFNCPFIDSPTTSAVYFASNGAGGPVQGVIKFIGGHFNGQNPITGITGMGVGVDIGGGAGTTWVDYLDFIGCHITGFRLSGVTLNRPGAVHIGFYNNWIFDNNLSDTAIQSGFILANGSTGLIIQNNHIANTVAGGGKMNYAVSQFGTLADSVIEGNTISGMTVARFAILGASTNVTRQN